MANLNQNDDHNCIMNFNQSTINPKYNQIIFYKNSAKNNLRFIDSDSNHVLRI